MKTAGQADDDSKSTEHFLCCISVDDRGSDEIYRMLDDMIVVDPHERHGSSRRSDKDLAAVLALLDKLNTETEDAP